MNQAGGIDGQPVHFAIQDDQTNPAVAVQLLNGVIAHNPAVVIGSSLVATCSAMAPLIANGPVTYCLSSGVHPTAGSYMFSAFFNTDDLIASSARYFHLRGWTKVATITSTDATGQDADRGIAAGYGPETGETIVDREHFNTTDLSVAAQLERIRASGAQVLVAWSTGTPIATILRGMVDAGLKIPVLPSTGNLTYAQMRAYAEYLRNTETYFAAAPFIAPDGVTDRNVKRAVDTFVNAFKAVGIKPDVAQGLGWDPPLLIIDALKHLGVRATALQIRDYINNIGASQNFTGVYGHYDFKKYPQRGLGVNQIQMVRWDPTKDAWIAVSKPGGDLR